MDNTNGFMNAGQGMESQPEQIGIALHAINLSLSQQVVLDKVRILGLKWLNIEETALLMNLTQGRLRELVREGRIACRKVLSGRREEWRVELREIARVLEGAPSQPEGRDHAPDGQAGG